MCYCLEEMLEQLSMHKLRSRSGIIFMDLMAEEWKDYVDLALNQNLMAIKSMTCHSLSGILARKHSAIFSLSKQCRYPSMPPYGNNGIPAFHDVLNFFSYLA